MRRLVRLLLRFAVGTVAAFEELVGNHGGLGGPQTEPFIVHPADMTVPPTTNSCDVFAVLDGRRGAQTLDSMG